MVMRKRSDDFDAIVVDECTRVMNWGLDRVDAPRFEGKLLAPRETTPTAGLRAHVVAPRPVRPLFPTRLKSDPATSNKSSDPLHGAAGVVAACLSLYLAPSPSLLGTCAKLTLCLKPHDRWHAGGLGIGGRR